MMFNIVPVILSIGFILVFAMIVVIIIQNIRQWQKNNDSPVLTVEATVVDKRADVSHYHHNAGMDNMNHMASSTIYYATFEVNGGDRREFKVRNKEYGLLAEGDLGKLTFQGTRYLGFTRNRG